MENILKVTTPIFLTISIYIGLIKPLKVSLLNAKYDLNGKLRESCTSVDLGYEGEIEEAMSAGNNKDDNNKDY